jgi:hypothetical protein
MAGQAERAAVDAGRPDIDALDDAVDTDPPEQSVLTEREAQILAFERQWWRHAGAKEQAIRDTFGLSGTRYYQLLNALLEHPAALEHDPMLVKRLRRLRATRVRGRARGSNGLSRGA